MLLIQKMKIVMEMVIGEMCLDTAVMAVLVLC